MSSVQPSTQTAKSCIETKGFLLVQDANDGTSDAKEAIGKGQRFEEFFNHGYLSRTPEGLQFFYENTKGDDEIWSTICSIIAQPRWGYLRYYSSLLSSEYAWFFHQRKKNNEKQPISTLIVQLWRPDSRVVYYEGTQLQFINAQEDPEDWGLMKTHRNDMKRQGITTTVEEMPNGGYAIIDARLGWTCERGGFTNMAFADDEEVAHWDPMQLRDTDRNRGKVDELESRGFKMHVTFVKDSVSTVKNS